MEDLAIVMLYWNRCETAIKETQQKYGRYCTRIAKNILQSDEDAEECVSDTYFQTWNSIPDHKPSMLSTYVGKITRNLAINRYKKNNRSKRGGGVVTEALDELLECIPADNSIEKQLEDQMIVQAINEFLRKLPAETCNVFLRRYWYMDSIQDISAQFEMSESKVKSILFRTRNKLKKYLEREEIQL